MIDVYISPENRNYPHGIYSGQDTFEKKECEKIADLLQSAFDRCGITYKRAGYSAKMAERCVEANKEGHKYYLSIHTNASGETPNNSVRGASVFYYKPIGGKSYNACKIVLDELVLLGLKNRGLTDKTEWYEPANSKGATVYCEIEFHDHPDGAKFIVENKQAIAEAICKGFCKILDRPYAPYKHEIEALPSNKENHAEDTIDDSAVTWAALRERLLAEGIKSIII